MPDQDAAMIRAAAAPEPGVDARHQEETPRDTGRATPMAVPERAAEASRDADRSAADRASRGTPANVSEIQETHRHYRREIVLYRPQPPARNPS